MDTPKCSANGSPCVWLFRQPGMWHCSGVVTFCLPALPTPLHLLSGILDISAPHLHSLSTTWFPSSFLSDCMCACALSRGASAGEGSELGQPCSHTAMLQQGRSGQEQCPCHTGFQNRGFQRVAQWPVPCWTGARMYPKWFGGLRHLNLLPGCSAENFKVSMWPRLGGKVSNKWRRSVSLETSLWKEYVPAGGKKISAGSCSPWVNTALSPTSHSCSVCNCARITQPGGNLSRTQGFQENTSWWFNRGLLGLFLYGLLSRKRGEELEVCDGLWEGRRSQELGCSRPGQPLQHLPTCRWCCELSWDLQFVLSHSWTFQLALSAQWLRLQAGAVPGSVPCLVDNKG